MAVKERIRVRLKSYDHKLIDTAAERSLKLLREMALQFPVLSRSPQREKSSQFSVRFTSTRIAVNSLSSEHTRDSLIFSSPLQRLQKLL